ncbi:endospore germination permease [Bacillus sp. EB106-08-02-XG196]|jgi:spore germination protein KB|uniref:GerAB/ArcD/ProY family transporter n=1 Tax=Bacillus sp. EB106-08-02-XG196 TaxID=2737049 RepID=UPI0015C43D97|nr:endospore germination permease [Bacillus sp. EB106-08-02-XG196]NWQ42557.1 endospore germination permease [Bacillus sp. EB106-08-02-XG196]
MIEKGRISSLQMAIMMLPTIIATGILLVPAITGKFAKQDMWMSPVWASLAGFLIVYIAYHLHTHYPKETVIQYSVKIIGAVPGKVVGFLYLFFYLHINGMVLREYGEFVVGNFLIKTPMLVVIGSMAFVCALAVRGGIEVLARTAQIFVPVVIILLFFIAILLLPDLEPKKMFPIMEKGVLPSLMGAIVPSSWFTEFFLLSFLLPFLGQREKGLKWGIIAVFAVMLLMVITSLVSLLLFGGITATFTYPVFSAVRYISIADFLQHLESIVMAIWVAGTFVKVSVFFYVLVIGTAQWLDLSDYRSLVLPIGFLLVTVSFWVAPDLQTLALFLSTSSPFYLFLIQFLLPTLLLIVSVIRKKNRRNREKVPSNINNLTAAVPESGKMNE